MLLTITTIVISVTIFGVLFFLLMKRILKNKLLNILEENKKKYLNHFAEFFKFIFGHIKYLFGSFVTKKP